MRLPFAVPSDPLVAARTAELDNAFRDDERVITSEVPDKDGIVDSIKQFLGTGR